jgi:two-component system, cell cycle sensor histidine kinase and response regulator CckA
VAPGEYGRLQRLVRIRPEVCARQESPGYDGSARATPPEETPRRVIAVDSGPSDLPAAAQKLAQSSKMEALGQLAGGVAHDFNNLLTVMAGYCELVAADPALGTSSTAYMEEIRTTIERARSLTQQILAFSRRQPEELRIVSLNEVVAGVTQFLVRTLGTEVEVVTCLDETLGPVEADPHQLEQVIVNLAVNARDAISDGGTLTIATRNCELDAEYRRTQPCVTPGPYVLLTVSDTGIGMDAETLARALEPFFTTKAQGEGTGLGLATVYGIVKQSGGHLELESEVGQGTTASVYLPCSPEQA